jgi:preprotein translocase subunit YajC
VAPTGCHTGPKIGTNGAFVDEFTGLLIPVFFLGLLWFLLIRPQSKRRREHVELVNSVRVGNDVVTIGGLHGRVVSVTETTVDITIDAEEDVVMRFDRPSIARILNRDDAA